MNDFDRRCIQHAFRLMSALMDEQAEVAAQSLILVLCSVLTDSDLSVEQAVRGIRDIAREMKAHKPKMKRTKSKTKTKQPTANPIALYTRPYADTDSFGKSRKPGNKN
jgi:hypothetical protein